MTTTNTVLKCVSSIGKGRNTETLTTEGKNNNTVAIKLHKVSETLSCILYLVKICTKTLKPVFIL